MVRAKGSRSHTHTGWWFAVALLPALAALFAWTAWQNEALRGRVAALERENRSLARALAARAAAAPPAATAASVAVVPAGPRRGAAPPGADPPATGAKPPVPSPRGGPLEEALQRLGEPVPRPVTSPFGRP